MNIKELQVSNLNITEDNYSYKGLFTLSGGGISISVDLADLDENVTINEIVEKFSLIELKEDIRKGIMEKVMTQASVSTEIKEGLDFQDGKNKTDRSTGSLDMA